MTTQTTYSPRIYVASLSDYNAGILHGAWIDAAQDVDAIWEEVRAILRTSHEPNVEVEWPEGSGVMVPSAEEWAIHDYDDFAGLKLGEYERFEKIADIARLLEERGEAFAVWYEYMDGSYHEDYAAMDSAFCDSYQGQYSSMTEYAEEFLESTGGLDGVPEHLQGYIDFESYGRDMAGDVVFQDGYVFTNS